MEVGRDELEMEDIEREWVGRKDAGEEEEAG